MPGLMFVVSAPSGAGKTTLLHKLFSEFPVLEFSVSTTTRKPRPGERDGVDYFFMSRQQFEKRRDAGEFAEWAEVHGNYYGTSRRWVDEALSQGRHVVFDIDVQGMSQLAEHYRQHMVTIFIVPPSLEELRRRLEGRGESSDTIGLRLSNARRELSRAQEYDYIVVNDDLDMAYGELRTIYRAALLRTVMRRAVLEGMTQ